MIPIEVQQGYVPVTGGRVWYQIVGAGDAIPLLVLHGGPAVPHNYLEPLVALSDERPVIFYDQLGCGRSNRPDDTSLWHIGRFAEEVGQVRQALGLEQVHLLTHSAGTIVALEYLLGQPEGVVSLTQVGPILSFPRLIADINRLFATLPEGMYAAVQCHEAAGTMDSEEYQLAVKEYRRRYMLRIEPEAVAAEDKNEGFGMQVYQTLWGPYELQVIGNLNDYDRSARAHEVTAPVLLICGRYDFCTPEETARYHQLVPESEMVVFEQARMRPMWKSRRHFSRWCVTFCGVWRPAEDNSSVSGGYRWFLSICYRNPKKHDDTDDEDGGGHYGYTPGTRKRTTQAEEEAQCLEEEAHADQERIDAAFDQLMEGLDL